MFAVCVAVFCAHALGAQTVGGEVVGLNTKKAIAPANIALVDDSARIVRTVKADSASGMFYVDAPQPGRYRVVVFVPSGSFISPMFYLDSGATVERLFSVPDVGATGVSGAYFPSEVTTLAKFIPGGSGPVYPERRARDHIRALVAALFVVDEHGAVNVDTFQVMNDAPADFANAVRDAVAKWHYIPAQKDGKAVSQVVQTTVDFGFLGDPDRGEIIVRALGLVRRKP